MPSCSWREGGEGQSLVSKITLHLRYEIQRKEGEEEAGAALAETHTFFSILSLAPFILSISPSQNSEQTTVIPGQFSQVRAYFFFFFSHPLESAFDWLGGTWQKEHMKQQQKAPHTLRVTLTLHYKAFLSTTLRDVQRRLTKSQVSAPLLLSKESWQLMLRMQLHQAGKSGKKKKTDPFSENKALDQCQFISINSWKDWQNNNQRDSDKI